MARRITVDYDPEADAAFVFFDCDELPRGGRTEVLGGSWRSGYAADYDKKGNLMALDLTGVSHGVDVDLLPHSEEVAEALRAAGFSVTRGRKMLPFKRAYTHWTEEKIRYMQKVGFPLPPYVKRKLKAQKALAQPSPVP